MSMEKLRQIFMLECQESLQQMEDALLHLETNPNDTEAIHLLFRSTHTIKGSADLVEFTKIAEFAHVMENVLDTVRSGKRAIHAEFINVMLACRDHINSLSEQSEDSVNDPSIQEHEAQLLEKLQHYLAEIPEAQPPPRPPKFDKTQPATQWYISLRFSEQAFYQGIEPSAALIYLLDFGEIIKLNTSFEAMPAATEMIAEHCYLGFELELKSAADQTTLEQLFEVIQDQCQVLIMPLQRPLSQDYVFVTRQTDEHETLIEVVSFTESFLALQQQASEQATETESTPPAAPPPSQTKPINNNTVLTKPQIKKKSFTHQTLYVDADKLDQLINLVGELVIAMASMNLQVTAHVDEALKEATLTMSRLVEDIRDRTLSMRMVRIHDTFNRFPRMVHDHCRELDKKIDLIITGADTELDKSMVEKIAEPLMHLVRNAIDHGIESPSERLAVGKPVTGTVQLNAYHNSGNIIIEVSDDGRGLDPEKILTTALKKGLVKNPKILSDTEVNRLIFEPGFSTSDHITQLSGRGVGLDSVKRSIHTQNGWVNIKSIVGQGTTVQISLPLTLAIIDGFLLGVGEATYVIPLDHVVECVELDEHSHLEEDYMNLRGHILPLLQLRKLFAVTQFADKPQREHVVVINYGGSQDCQAGLVVNELLGEFQAVIKPLGKIFEKLTGISGATILGNGEVALILDVPALVQRYGILNGLNKPLYCPPLSASRPHH